MSKDFPIKDIINYENHIGWDLITPDGKYIRFSDNTEHKPFIYDEIKEILDDVKECCDITKDQNFFVYQRQDILKLLDYITNLQEENKELKKKITFNEKSRRKMQQSLMEQIETYKSKNEKAVEFIKEKISSTKGVINDYMYHKEHNKHLIELLNEDIEMYKNELSILQGEDKYENN